MSNSSPWHRLYQTKRWARIRKRQLAEFPLCRICLEKGQIVPATEVDHVVPHNANEWAFWSGELQSLCRSDHARKSNEEMGNRTRPIIGADGFPA